VSRTTDGRMVGVNPETFHGLSDAERKEAADLLMKLNGYRWWTERQLWTPEVMVDVGTIASTLREARRAITEKWRKP